MRSPGRRAFLNVMVLGVIVSFLRIDLSYCRDIGSISTRPNIIVFLSDDHGYHDAGCYGNTAIRTPNLNRLATEGVRMTRAFAASPTSTPSRCALFTGLMPYRSGARTNKSRVFSRTKSLVHYLRTLDYRVVLMGKREINPRQVFPFEYIAAGLDSDESSGDRDGEDSKLDMEQVDGLLTDHAADQNDVPLCLIIASSSPQSGWPAETLYEPNQVVLPAYMVDTPATRDGMARYFTKVTMMDEQIGQCLDSMEQHGFVANTIFMYLSDHGPEWPHAKWNLYDAGIRVPMIIRWPERIRGGSVCESLISLADITPTLIELAGGTVDEDLDGCSFLTVLLDNRMPHRDAIFSTHTADGKNNTYPIRCIRTATHKYIVNLKPDGRWTSDFTEMQDADHADIWKTWQTKSRYDSTVRQLIKNLEQRPAEELYDLRVDPYELNNIASADLNRATIVSLRARLEEWMLQQRDMSLRTWKSVQNIE